MPCRKRQKPSMAATNLNSIESFIYRIHWLQIGANQSHPIKLLKLAKNASFNKIWTGTARNTEVDFVCKKLIGRN